MIRTIGIAVGITVALMLPRTGADQVVVRAQNGFVDPASHVPPSPSYPGSKSRSVPVTVVSPAPA